MNKKSDKVIETEKWVDEYIARHGSPPTYVDISIHFKLAKSVAYARCKKFRHKMKAFGASEKFTKVKIEYLVPNSKM